MKWTSALVSVLFVVITALLSSLFTVRSAWYASVEPAWSPPGWVFSVAWSILYVCLMVCLYRMLESRLDRRVVLLTFGLNLLLQIVWTATFFGAQMVLGGLFVLAVLWLLTLGMIVYFYRYDVLTSGLLVLYWLWLSFACILNFQSLR